GPFLAPSAPFACCGAPFDAWDEAMGPSDTHVCPAFNAVARPVFQWMGHGRVVAAGAVLQPRRGDRRRRVPDRPANAARRAVVGRGVPRLARRRQRVVPAARRARTLAGALPMALPSAVPRAPADGGVPPARRRAPPSAGCRRRRAVPALPGALRPSPPPPPPPPPRP